MQRSRSGFVALTTVASASDSERKLRENHEQINSRADFGLNRRCSEGQGGSPDCSRWRRNAWCTSSRKLKEFTVWTQDFGLLLVIPQAHGTLAVKSQTLLMSAARCTKSSRQIVTKPRKRLSRSDLSLCARVAHCRPRLRLTKPINGKRHGSEHHRAARGVG